MSKKKTTLIGVSIICILLLSFIFCKIITDKNAEQNNKTANETSVSEKQQLFEIVTNPDLTDEEKAERAEQLLDSEKEPQNPSASENKSESGKINTEDTDPPSIPKIEMVKEVILDPNLTNEQKTDALDFLLYTEKEQLTAEEEKIEVKIGTPTIQGNSKKTSLKLSELELLGLANLSYFDKHCLVFYLFNNEKLTYYKYDMDTQQTQEMGTIQKPTIWSGCHISLGNILYFTVNTDSFETPVTHLYKLEPEKGSLEELTKESLYQTMVYLDTDGNSVLSYKGDRIDGQPVTYIEKTDVNTGLQEQLISNAGYIQSFSCANDKIYVLCHKDKNYVMEVYSLSGTLLSEIVFPELLDLFDESYIGTIKVFGEYVFIGNESLQGALYRLHDDTAELMFYGQDREFMLAEPGNSENLALSSYVYLYQSETPYIFVIDVEKSDVYRKELILNPECPYLDNVMGNDSQVIIKTADSDYETLKTYLVEGAIYAKNGTEKDMNSVRNYNLDNDVK